MSSDTTEPEVIRVSDVFKLSRSQGYLDFVDVPLNTDLAVFVDPVAIRSMRSDWAHECISLIQVFFEQVLRAINKNRHYDAQRLLSSLRERNDFHFGYSTERSRGRAFGSESAHSVWNALRQSKAAKSNLLSDLEDSILFIPRIGPDLISDAVCNIIRGPLIAYTQSICRYYGMPLDPEVESGAVWDPVTGEWVHSFVPLPMTPYGRVILVPKRIVRHSISYDQHSYYHNYLLPRMQAEELRLNSNLVEVLKNGRRRITKKALMEKYGAGKLATLEQTIRFPDVLKQYKQSRRLNAQPPLPNAELEAISRQPRSDPTKLLHALSNLPSGIDHATKYQELIEQILSATLYPSLCMPVKEDRIHNGRKRIDITYENEATHGIFARIAGRIPAQRVFVECKNYGKEVGNPELDQLAGRFGPSRGQFGILVCRSITDRDLLIQRCQDTANDERGYIICMDDDDVTQLVQEFDPQSVAGEYPIIQKLLTATGGTW